MSARDLSYCQRPYLYHITTLVTTYRQGFVIRRQMHFSFVTASRQMVDLLIFNRSSLRYMYRYPPPKTLVLSRDFMLKERFHRDRACSLAYFKFTLPNTHPYC